MVAMVAVILAGGLSRRLGGVPKAGLLQNGKTLLARTVEGAARAMDPMVAQPTDRTSAQPTVKSTPAGGGVVPGPRIAVVGPEDRTREWLADAESNGDVVFVQEDPPFSGPAAGIAAGLAALAARAALATQPVHTASGADNRHVLVLACDMPRAGEVAAVLTAELAGCGAESGIMAVDDGRKQPLAGIYPLKALQSSVAAARQTDRLQNASVFSLLASVNIKECVVPVGLTADIDTWQDARAQGIGAEFDEAERQ